jgi:hypothetical protein
MRQVDPKTYSRARLAGALILGLFLGCMAVGFLMALGCN